MKGDWGFLLASIKFYRRLTLYFVMVKEIVDIVQFLKDYIEQTKETIQIVKTFDSDQTKVIQFKK